MAKLSLLNTFKGQPVRNWPFFNATNLNLIDDTIGAIGPTSYIPELTSHADTPPSLGATGAIRGFWYNVLDIVFVTVYLEFGSDGSPGSGDANYFLVSLPFPSVGLVAEGATARGTIIGRGHARDNSSPSNSQTLAVQLSDNDDRVIFVTEKGQASSLVRHDSPFTWATSDSISWTASYRGAI